jgi:hypothetical protein
MYRKYFLPFTGSSQVKKNVNIFYLLLEVLK